MKKFNQVITVQVSVDNIADQFLNTLNQENPHAELLTETVIGAALASDKLGYIYNALNGYTNNINFKVGQHVHTNEAYYDYKESKRKPIGNCKITEIDIYRENKVRVEYEYVNSDGKLTTSNQWVNHTELTEPVVEAAEVSLAL